VAQDGAGAHLLFCTHGAATLRCAVLGFQGPAKGGREKQGGQLRADAKKPIVALSAHPCDRYAPSCHAIPPPIKKLLKAALCLPSLAG
jgi:hypothetical protein